MCLHRGGGSALPWPEVPSGESLSDGTRCSGPRRGPPPRRRHRVNHWIPRVASSPGEGPSPRAPEATLPPAGLVRSMVKIVKVRWRKEPEGRREEELGGVGVTEDTKCEEEDVRGKAADRG